MIIQRKKQISYIRNLAYPVLGNDVQKDLDDTDSVTFSRFASRKAVCYRVPKSEFEKEVL